MTNTMKDRMEALAAKMEKAREGVYPHREPGWGKQFLIDSVMGKNKGFTVETFMGGHLVSEIESFIRDAWRERMDHVGNTFGECDKKIAYSTLVFSSENVPYGEFDAWVKRVAKASAQPVDWVIEGNQMMPDVFELSVKTTGDVIRVCDAVDLLLPDHDEMYMKANSAKQALSKNSPSRRFTRIRLKLTYESLQKELGSLNKRLNDSNLRIERLTEENQTLQRRLAERGRYARAWSDVSHHLRAAYQSARSMLPKLRDYDDE